MRLVGTTIPLECTVDVGIPGSGALVWERLIDLNVDRLGQCE